MKLHQFILPALAVASPACVAPQSGANSTDVYDYIVIGSGPGGGTISVNLAKAGYSVLLLEAGEDRSEDIRTQVHSLGSFSNTEATWHFFVRHSDDEARNARYNLLVWRLANGEYWIGKDPSVEGHVGATRLGVFYPRGATLGGSAVVNAAATFLPMDSDWDYFDKGVGDGIWSGKDMRRIFEKIEHNNYLPEGTPGHGFTGWLQTNIASSAVYAGTLRMKIFEAGLRLIGKDPSKAVEYSTTDGNFLSPTRDQEQGLWALPFHVEPNWRRWSPRDRILQTLAEKKAPLKVSLNSLASKVLFDECGYGKPKAVGVEYLQGKNIFRADPHYKNSNAGTKKKAFARKEVIVSGGAFSSPQILQLSGIGDKKLLKSLNIKVISDLPGVGRNLQDNYELPIIGEAKISLAPPVDPNAPKCTQGAPGDPCLDLWRQGKGPYAQGGSNANSFMLKTKYAVENERDMLMFSTGDFPLRGFVPDTNQNMTRDPPTTFSWSTVKMHPQNGAGYIKIKSTNPQDTPDINLNYFAEGGETDLNAILETIAFGRKAYATTEGPVGPVKPFSPPCPNVLADGTCSDVNIDKDWIKDQAFGHHPTSSNSVGPDSNPLAVLDTRLRVKGVRNLRVVDASAFPRCPGAFPAVASFMLGEKATELVLEDAKKNN